MIETGGKCKKCGHDAKEHHTSFPIHAWIIFSCYKCDCDEYIDSDKK